MPTGKFADKEVVINFVMRHYDYGGYVEVKDRTSIFYDRTDNSVQTNFDHKQMTYRMLLGSNYEKNDMRTTNIEDLHTDKNFQQSSMTLAYPIKNHNNYVVVGARYRSKALQLTGSAGITKKETPEYHYSDDITYSGDIAGYTSANSTVGSKNTTTFVRAQADWQASDKQNITFDTYITFGNNHYDNTYRENDGYSIDSHTKENTFGVEGDVCYVNNINRRSCITLEVYENYNHYNDHYRGTLSADQTTSQSETIVWPIYT